MSAATVPHLAVIPEGHTSGARGAQDALKAIRLLHKYGRHRSESHCLLVSDPAGSQASAAIQQYRTNHPDLLDPEDGFRRPILYVNLEAPCTLKALTKVILTSLGEHHFPRETTVDITYKIVRALKEQKVELLIIDGAHNLVDQHRPLVIRDFGDWIKTQLNKNICPIVLAGRSQIKRLVELNEQLAGRCDGHVRM